MSQEGGCTALSAILTAEHATNTESPDPKRETRTGQIRPLNPRTSLSLAYLRAYTDEHQAHRNKRKQAQHLLRMHWQHVPGKAGNDA